MLNVIGQDTAAATLAPLEVALGVPGASIHWYGKTEIRKGRKLGHITVVAADADTLKRAIKPLEPFIAPPLSSGSGDEVSVSGAIQQTASDGGEVFSIHSAQSASRAAGPASPVVGIIMGSDSDLPTMKEAAIILQRFEVPFELTIVSAHRTPDRMVIYAKTAHQRGLRCIIAGMHLLSCPKSRVQSVLRMLGVGVGSSRQVPEVPLICRVWWPP